MLDQQAIILLIISSVDWRPYGTSADNTPNGLSNMKNPTNMLTKTYILRLIIIGELDETFKFSFVVVVFFKNS